ncbi:MAG: hypothetical protein KAX93_04665 [Flavobacterium sp.]|nr:hypothetical protein [Flavobacterium sp.]
MTTSAIKHVNSKLKNLPDTLLGEVEKYIDFLAFKHSQETSNIPQWHQDIVLERIKDEGIPSDAFEMINSLED